MIWSWSHINGHKRNSHSFITQLLPFPPCPALSISPLRHEHIHGLFIHQDYRGFKPFVPPQHSTNRRSHTCSSMRAWRGLSGNRAMSRPRGVKRFPAPGCSADNASRHLCAAANACGSGGVGKGNCATLSTARALSASTTPSRGVLRISGGVCFGKVSLK